MLEQMRISGKHFYMFDMMRPEAVNRTLVNFLRCGLSVSLGPSSAKALSCSGLAAAPPASAGRFIFPEQPEVAPSGRLREIGIALLQAFLHTVEQPNASFCCAPCTRRVRACHYASRSDGVVVKGPNRRTVVRAGCGNSFHDWHDLIG